MTERPSPNGNPGYKQHHNPPGVTENLSNVSECRAMIVSGSTKGLDSSGRSVGERWTAVTNALGQRGSKSVIAAP